MQVNRDLILKLESLSQLELSEGERELMQHDLQNIIDMVDRLNEINTDGLEPLVHLGTDQSQLREDAVGDQLNRNDALDNASVKDEKYFLVPKVIEK